MLFTRLGTVWIQALSVFRPAHRIFASRLDVWIEINLSAEAANSAIYRRYRTSSRLQSAIDPNALLWNIDTIL